MISGRISDFIFGLTGFTVSEGFADEFISECRKRKIVIYRMKREGNTVCGYVHYPDGRRLFDAADSSGMRVDITVRSGLPHIIVRYRKHFGIPAGLLVFTVITAILHSVLWSIDITPTQFIAREEIMELLQDAGVRTGAFSDTVSCKDIEYMLYEHFDGISWVNARIIGTRMFVDISEVKVKEKNKEPLYTNIVAAKDGEIVMAKILRGEGTLHPGTAVVKGDLLISGIINHRDGSVKFVEGEGKIFARTKNFIVSSIPSSITTKTMKKCKDIYLPVFFGISLSDFVSVKHNNFTLSRYFLDGGDVVLPLGVIRKFVFELEETELELSENESVLLCFRDFAVNSLKLYKTAEILENDIKINFMNGAEISGSFLTIEDIALKKEFTVEEN